MERSTDLSKPEITRWSTVVARRDGPVATLVLNRPHVANALDRVLVREAVEAVDHATSDEAVRVLVVTGAGDRHFCAGADLRDLAAARRDGEPFMPPRAIWDVLESLDIPVIAAVNGAAMGGGLEIALAADLRIVASHAMLGLPEISHGMIPGGGGTARLPRTIGLGRAKEMIILGRRIDAATAHAWGLANEVVPGPDLDARVAEVAGELAELDPSAVRAAKLVLTVGPEIDRRSAIELERSLARTVGRPASVPPAEPR